ncbi:MAG: hypothetical protein EOP50_04105 [Sphingobacteriales bacterium]|nr:MAG: hypothetical protein EOP50_04105 [Sphingobacteriales bacterium]
MYPTVSVRALHLEYKLWSNELDFNKEEIGIFEKHLEPIVSNYTDVDVRARVEQYQNRFIRHKEVIDELKHKLHGSEVQLATFVRDMSGMGIDSVKMDNHVKLRDDVRRFRELYGELKNEFRRFEADWY